MIKKLAINFGIISLLLALCACGGTKTVHCNNCSAEISVDADSKMTEDRVFYCEPCSEELFSGEDLIGDDILPEISTAQ